MKKIFILFAAIILITLSCKKDKTIELKPTKCLPISKIEKLYSNNSNNNYIYEYTYYKYNSKMQLINVIIEDDYHFITDEYNILYRGGKITEVLLSRGLNGSPYGKRILEYNDRNQMITLSYQNIEGDSLVGELCQTASYEYPNENTIKSIIPMGSNFPTYEYVYEFDENGNVSIISCYSEPSKYITSRAEYKYDSNHQPYRNLSLNLNLLFRNNLSKNQFSSATYYTYNYNGSENEPNYWTAEPDYYQYNELGYPTSIGRYITYAYLSY